MRDRSAMALSFCSTIKSEPEAACITPNQDTIVQTFLRTIAVHFRVVRRQAWNKMSVARILRAIMQPQPSHASEW